MWLLVSVLLAGALALGIMVDPLITGGVLVVISLPLLGVFVPSWSPAKVFLTALGALLVGYAFFGRAFAYIGVAPFYIGEVVLALGLVAALLGVGVSRMLRSPVSWLLIAFASWGAMRTFPFIGTYGWVALRDAVIWGYSAIAIVAGASLLRVGRVGRVFSLYGRIVPALLIWIPIAVVAASTLDQVLPAVPGTEVKLLEARPLDMAVQLAGAAAFMLLGMLQATRSQVRDRQRSSEWLCWAAWVAGFVVVASQSRAGLLSIGVAGLIVLTLRPSARWWKAAALFAAAAVLFAALDLGSDPRMKGRDIAPDQIAENLQSVAESDSDAALEGTKEWRLQWWRNIIDTTLFGDYFWLGRGYGINLALDFDEKLDPEGTLRSPHNSHLTVLARGGVPGLVLWIALQGSFAALLLRSFFQARQAGDAGWADVFVWVLATWAAFMVDAFFSVFLESPQIGIPFWSLFGFGIAAMEMRREAVGSGDLAATGHV
jgi:hypothetical protein